LLKMGGDKITAKKVNFSKSIKVPRSLVSFLLLILKQCMSTLRSGVLKFCV